MKNIIQKFLVLCCSFLMLTLVSSGQSTLSTSNKSQSPYEKMTLKFVIEGEPTLESVGLDNPKSSWKFSYELRFLSERNNLKGYTPPSLNKTSNLSQSERQKSVTKSNKAFEKAWKKSSVVVVKGKVPKSLLSDPKNREIIVPVELTPEVKNILAAATDTWANPEFKVRIKGTITTQTASGMKFKKKISDSYVCFSKFQTKDSQLWMMNSCGISLRLSNINNKILQGGTSVLQ